MRLDGVGAGRDGDEEEEAIGGWAQGVDIDGILVEPEGVQGAGGGATRECQGVVKGGVGKVGVDVEGAALRVEGVEETGEFARGKVEKKLFGGGRPDVVGAGKVEEIGVGLRGEVGGMGEHGVGVEVDGDGLVVGVEGVL